MIVRVITLLVLLNEKLFFFGSLFVVGMIVYGQTVCVYL